jgi:uncharacterized protein YkwD
MRGAHGRAIVLATAAWLAVAPASFAGGAPASSDAFERRVLALVNAERSRRGIARLQRSRCPDTHAARWSNALARSQRLRHQDVEKVLYTCGARRAGENIGVTQGSAEELMESWMRSRRHRANILDPRYRSIGLGASRSENGRWWVVQNFLAF